MTVITPNPQEKKSGTNNRLLFEALLENHLLRLTKNGPFAHERAFGSSISLDALAAAKACVNFDNGMYNNNVAGGTFSGPINGVYAAPAAAVQGYNAILLWYATFTCPLLPRLPPLNAEHNWEGIKKLEKLFQRVRRDMVELPIALGWRVGDDSSVSTTTCMNVVNTCKDTCENTSSSSNTATITSAVTINDICNDDQGTLQKQAFEQSFQSWLSLIIKDYLPHTEEPVHVLLARIKCSKPFFSSPSLAQACILFPIPSDTCTTTSGVDIPSSPWDGPTLTVYGHAPLVLRAGVGYLLPPSLFTVVESHSAGCDGQIFCALLLLLPWPSAAYLSTCTSPPSIHGGIPNSNCNRLIDMHPSDVCFRVMHVSDDAQGSVRGPTTASSHARQHLLLYSRSLLEMLPARIHHLIDYEYTSSDTPILKGSRWLQEEIRGQAVVVAMYRRLGGVLGVGVMCASASGR